jgi:hypothetical protein
MFEPRPEIRMPMREGIGVWSRESEVKRKAGRSFSEKLAAVSFSFSLPAFDLFK